MNKYHAQGRLGKILLAAAIVASTLLVAPAAQAATPAPQASAPTGVQALEALQAQLRAAAANGDSLAGSNLNAYSALTSTQRTELGLILSGQSEVNSLKPSARARHTKVGSADIAVDGDSVWTYSESATTTATVASSANAAPLAAAFSTVTRNVWGTQSFAFAGITLTQTKVWGKYTTNGTTVTSIVDYGIQLVINYQPFTYVTVTPQSATTNGISVTFKGKVRVDRGPIYGWYWSSAEAYHTVKANTSGGVISNTLG